MAIQQLFTYLLVYIIPAIALFAMACMVIANNYKKTENRLVALLFFLYSFLFFEEFLRHLLPLSYSPILVHLFIINVGMLIHSVMFHFYIHVTKLQERIKIPFYPMVFYVPVFIILTIMLLSDNNFDNTEIVQSGIWYVPTFKTYYYLVVTISTVFIMVLIVILINGMKYTTSIIKYQLLRLLTVGTCAALVLKILLGYPNYRGAIPPFPTLIIGILLTVLLSISVYRFQLLPSVIKRYQTMFNLSPVSMIVLNEEWEILEFNEQARKEILFYGHKDSRLTDLVQSDFNKKELYKFFDLLKKESEIKNHSISFERIGLQGMLHYTVDASTILIEDKMLFYTIWRNVTVELEKERLIEHMAYHDALTGLHNRAYFVGRVQKKLIELSAAPTRQSALVLIDLNRFKQINDVYGHAVGDQVLQHTATILTEAVRQNDTVARLGGDEFVIFLEEFPTKDTVIDWKNRLHEAFKQNLFKTASITIQIELSIGISYFPTDGDNLECLFQVADTRMYENKLVSREEGEPVQ